MSGYMLLRTSNIECPPHFNAELEILYVESGRVSVAYDSETICVPAGEAILILPYRIHGFKPSMGAQATVFMFSYSIAEEWFRDHKVSNIARKSFQINEALQQYITYALMSFESNPHIAVIKGIFYAFISEYMHCHLFSNETVNNEQEIIDEIIGYITDGNTDLTLAEVCKALGLNKKKVGKLFIDTWGIKFSELINNVRLEKASILLQRGSMSITEIAYQTGFGSPRSFNRVFAKKFGCTPTEYRKEEKIRILKGQDNRYQ